MGGEGSGGGADSAGFLGRILPKKGRKGGRGGENLGIWDLGFSCIYLSRPSCGFAENAEISALKAAKAKPKSVGFYLNSVPGWKFLLFPLPRRTRDHFGAESWIFILWNGPESCGIFLEIWAKY